MAPKQKPGLSRQDYGTPPEFLTAIKNRLGISEFYLDLAASKDNAIAPSFYTEETNSLSEDIPWSLGDGWSWLNPPFSNIKPWVEKAWGESQNRNAKIAMLVPAAVGSNWWRDWVDGKAHVLLLNGRLTFVGEKTCYPKDCALLLYTSFVKGGYEIWNWRK